MQSFSAVSWFRTPPEESKCFPDSAYAIWRESGIEWAHKNPEAGRASYIAAADAFSDCRFENERRTKKAAFLEGARLVREPQSLHDGENQ